MELPDNNIENWCSDRIAEEDSDGEQEEKPTLNEEVFRKEFAEWAIRNQPPKDQLKELLQIFNKSLPFKLPNDPRTLMRTPRDTYIHTLSDGSEYWHHGVRQPLKNILSKQCEYPAHIHLNVNVDGLPIFESGKDQFWPILCNIHELSFIEPFVVGIFCGKSECNSTNSNVTFIFYSCFFISFVFKSVLIFQRNHRLQRNFCNNLWTKWFCSITMD